MRKGFLLGLLVGAGLMVWNAPQPGWRTREQIIEAIEGVLFKLLDMPGRLVQNSTEPVSDMLVNVTRPDAPPVESLIAGDPLVLGLDETRDLIVAQEMR